MFHAATAETSSNDLKALANESIQTRQSTQESNDNWQIEKAKLEARLAALREKNHRLTKEQKKLITEVDYYTARNQQLTWEIQQSAVIAREISPFLEELFDKLRLFIQADTPFLETERHDRLTRLRALLDNPEMSIGEKYRRTMEALLVELEYANTIEVYQDIITLENGAITVNIFRLGRVSLFFQTADGQITGKFNPLSHQWETLPRRYNREINIAMEIASKQRPIEIVNLPLGKTSTP